MDSDFLRSDNMGSECLSEQSDGALSVNTINILAIFLHPFIYRIDQMSNAKHIDYIWQPWALAYTVYQARPIPSTVGRVRTQQK